jgi:hypothetical protein
MRDYSNYLTFDLPIQYKKLLLYPVVVKDYIPFSYYSSCLKTDKNSIPDAKFITMSELEYLYYVSQSENDTPYVLLLDRLLGLVLRDDDSFSEVSKSILRYKYTKNNKPIFIIGEEEYTAKDFLEIKNIIATQNDIELPDTNISKEVRDSFEKARDYKRKIHGEKPASLEDYIVSLSVATGWSMEYIYSMPIRKFQKAISRMDNYIHYKIYLSASMSGMVEFKDKSFIKHWLSNLDAKDKYADVSVNLDALQSKISLESAKK